MPDDGKLFRAVRTAWAIVQLALLFVLVGVTAYTVSVFAHDDFPLGETMLCMATWVVAPFVWLLTWSGRKLFSSDSDSTPHGFEVVTRSDPAPPVTPKPTTIEERNVR